MGISNKSTVVTFDADTIFSVVEEATNGSIRSFVEYNEEEFNIIYADNITVSLYDNEEHMLKHFERIHSYVHLDFAEMSLFTDKLFPLADRVRFLATGLSEFTLLRVYIGDEGLLLALDPDESIEPLISTIEETLPG